MQKGLGKGLGALIPSAQEEAPKTGIEEVEIGKIRASKYQPRKKFDPARLNDLVSSIKEKGVVQPVLVRVVGEGEYELIAGERRLRAAREAGLSKIPVIIKDVKDEDILELSLIENIQRDNLDPLEEAGAYKRLLDEFNLTHEDISKRVGKDRSTITNTIRLLNLPVKIQEHVSRETISVGHARVLLSIEDPVIQDTICDSIIKNGLSVRQTENLVTNLKKRKEKLLKTHVTQDVHILDAEKQLQYMLGTKVKIKGTKKGRIEIYYFTLDELNRIYEILKKLG